VNEFSIPAIKIQCLWGRIPPSTLSIHNDHYLCRLWSGSSASPRRWLYRATSVLVLRSPLVTWLLVEL
jgi:hypothetical protein